MAGVDYRQLQSPEQVDTNLPDNGAAARAQVLGSVFKEFEGISGDVYNKVQTQAGALAGAASGATGHPQYREGLERLTAYSQAFNNAATGAYAIQAQAQADDAAARLRVQANNDPAAFQSSFTAVRDAVLKTAPAMAVPMLTELYNRHLATGIAAVSGDQATEQRNTQRQEYSVGVDRQISRVAELMGSDNPHDHLQAQDEQVKLSLLIDGGKNSGLYSAAEASAMHINAARAVTGQVFSTQVDRELSRPDGDVVGLLNNFRAMHLADMADTTKPPTLSEAEYQKLFADASTKVSEWRLTQETARSGAKTAEQIRWEAGDVKFTAAVLNGQTTQRQLANAVLSGDLKSERATSLAMMMSQGAVLKSDPRSFLHAMQDPKLPGMTPDDIASLPNISNADKIKIGTEAERQRNSWEGTQNAKDAIGVISTALKVPPGTPNGMLSDTQKTAVANATVEFKAKINALPPEQRAGAMAGVAKEVIGGVQKQIVQDQITGIQSSLERLQAAHGPGSPEQWPPEKLQNTIEKRQAQIKALRQQLQGK